MEYIQLFEKAKANVLKNATIPKVGIFVEFMCLKGKIYKIITMIIICNCHRITANMVALNNLHIDTESVSWDLSESMENRFV